MASGLRTASFFFTRGNSSFDLPQVRDTSVSDLILIGFWPSMEDTL